MNYFKILAVLFFLSFFSCQKEDVKPNNNNVVVDNKVYEFLDINWVLHSGRFYMENLDNGNKTFYDHFGSTQPQSTLNPVNGASVPLDTIMKTVTTWRFSQNVFTLNGDKQYNFNHSSTSNTIMVYGLENGSSKPMTIVKIDDNSITFKTSEAYGSFNGDNYKFFTTVTFVKPGVSCNNCQPNAYYGYVYNGQTNNYNEPSQIVGTKWVVTRFYDGFANSYPNDTLHFVSNNKYTINGGTQYNYTLNNVFGNNMSELTLYNFFTIGGGDYSALVPSDFISVGELNSTQFNGLFGVGTSKKVWMVKI
jgi:hypothetical protein